MNQRERDRLERRREGDRRFFVRLFGFLAGILILGLIAIAYAIGYGNGKDEGRKLQPAATQVATQAATTETQATQTAGAGQELFASKCGECHTLAAAGATGSDAPNLDALKPDQATVLAAIREGPAEMPTNLVTGAQAQQLAAFVAANAGR
jgi:mono/diheme cytochrome c family protein